MGTSSSAAIRAAAGFSLSGARTVARYCNGPGFHLHRELRGKLYRSCAHLKGHGGVKGALRYIARRQPNYRYVARFDVARYYESMRHDLLLDLLGRMGASSQSRAIVKD